MSATSKLLHLIPGYSLFSGSAGVVGVGYAGLTPPMVQAQIDAASRGQWVATPMDAVPRGEQSRARQGATTVGQAALRSAYWIAVLARVEKDRSLVGKARALLASGANGSQNRSAIASVFDQALAAISTLRGTSAVRYVRATLRSQASQTGSAQRRDREARPVRSHLAPLAQGRWAPQIALYNVYSKATEPPPPETDWMTYLKWGTAGMVLLAGVTLMRRRRPRRRSRT